MCFVIFFGEFEQKIQDSTWAIQDFKKCEGVKGENENTAESSPNWKGWKMLSYGPKQTKKWCTTQRGSPMQRKGLLYRT